MRNIADSQLAIIGLGYVGLPLAVACCKAGVIGGWQGGTYTRDDEFEAYLKALDRIGGAPPIVNIPARWGSDPKWQARIDMLGDYRAPIILSSLGDPSALVIRVHQWGGRVIQDVTTMKHAEKAIAAGVDGLMLTCAGAGGHTGFLTPLAFVPAVPVLLSPCAIPPNSLPNAVCHMSAIAGSFIAFL